MRKNIAKVIAAFQAHKSAKGDTKGTCWTDGAAIYSYSLKIAERNLDGSIWIHERNSTRTTNSQIDACAMRLLPPCRHTDCADHPELAEACNG